MTDERGTPTDGESAGVQMIQRAGEINRNGSTRPPRYFDRWQQHRDRVNDCSTGHRNDNGCAHNGQARPGALGSRCWVPAFNVAVELGLVDGDALAFSATDAEVAA